MRVGGSLVSHRTWFAGSLQPTPRQFLMLPSLLSCLLMFPRCLRRAPEPMADISRRVCSRRARHGCRSVHRLARDGLSVDPAIGEERRGEGSRLGNDSMSLPARPNARPWMAGLGVGNKAAVSPGMAWTNSQKEDAMRGRKLRGRLFWLLLELLPKVTRRQAKNVRNVAQESTARAQAHAT